MITKNSSVAASKKSRAVMISSLVVYILAEHDDRDKLTYGRGKESLQKEVGGRTGSVGTIATVTPGGL